MKDLCALGCALCLPLLLLSAYRLSLTSLRSRVFFYNALMSKQAAALALLLLFLLFPLSLKAESVESSETYAGYLAMPEARSGPLPVIVLIHEWWGLNDEMRARADRFAAKGFAALAVDLFSGQSTLNPMEAHALSQGLSPERAMEDLKGVLSYLQKNSDVDSKKIGVIGWGMGAKLALRLTLEDERARAVALFYGMPDLNEESLAKLKVPVLGIFGTGERGVSRDAIGDFRFRLEQLGKRAKIYDYEGVGYSFATPGDSAYHEKAAAEAWQNTFIFFKQNLS